MKRTATRVFWFALLLLGVATPIAAARISRPAQTGAGNDTNVCLSIQAPLDAIIAACTSVIGQSGLSDKTLAAYLYHRGTAYSLEGEYDRAMPDLSESVRLAPDDGPSHYSRGYTYGQLGDLKDARTEFLEARRLAPNDQNNVSGLAHVEKDLAAAAEQARAIAAMGRVDIKALQQRLTNDGCYRGPIDGQPNTALDDGVRSCPSQDPILRIETGGHTADIRSIRADAQCRILATTSQDKTTRVWSAADGHLLHTLRMPIGPGAGGEGNAVAVSPDGRYIATAGYDTQLEVTHRSFVYVFDASTGAEVARPLGFGTAISGLAFSPDGRWLAVVGGYPFSGLRVYDTGDWHLAMSDYDYNHTYIYAIAFGPDGDLYTAGFDARLHRYSPGPSFVREQTIAMRAGHTPMSIAADPRGQLVAVSFADVRGASVYDAKTLQLRFVVNPPRGGAGSLSTVGWSSDGDHLFGGGYQVLVEGHWRHPLLRFDRNGRPAGTATIATEGMLSLAACGSGMALIGGSGFGVLDPTGMRYWRASAAVDMRNKLGSAFTIEPDAKQVRFGLSFADAVSTTDFPIADPVVFDLARGTLNGAPTPSADFIAPITTTLPIEHWFGQFKPTFARRPMAFEFGEYAYALAIRPDREGFVLGTIFRLRAYAQDGLPRWEVHSASGSRGVNISADGRIVVAADGDGTIRWHRWSDGRELLALFVDKQTKRWVAWTPKGYYMASPGGEDLIGWQINRGWDQAADFFPASRFRTRFNRPDIVRLVLDTLDEDAAIKQANAAAGRTEDAQPLIAQLPPLIRVLDPAGGAHVPDGRVTIGYSFRSPSGLPVDRIVVTIDGRPVKEVGLPVHSLSGDQETKGSVAVPLGTRESDVGLIAWSGDRSSQAAHVDVVWEGAPATTAAQRKLYALVVGVGDYADADMKLTYAAKDARDFAKALTDQQGLYYGAVQTRVLTDREVTRASMSDGLAWLKQVATSPDDVSVLFLAGHGLTDAKGTYWFFPADADADTMSAKGVSQEAMRQAMQDLKGKVLWFLDTCHAGAAAKRAPVDVDRLLNTVTAAENGGIVVFASSTGLQVSVESKDLGNGAFTKALVEGIAQGKAASFDRSKVTTSSLDGFLEQTVSQLTGGQQTPVMERPPQEHDFTIAAVRK